MARVRRPAAKGLGALTLLVAVALPVACTTEPPTAGAPPPTAGGPSSPVESSPATGAPSAAGALARIPWAGGPAYYKRFPQAAAAGWTRPDFFPVGVWFESVLTQGDVDLDRAAGLNTYFELTNNSDMDLVRRNGMVAVPSELLPGHGAETVGWLLSDEIDMWAGPGDAGWTGNYPGQGSLCIPEDAGCGFTVLQTLSGQLPGDGRMRYANFGKGVMMWQNDDDAARFVNGSTDIVSTDIYWYTDGNICFEAEHFFGIPQDQCRRAAHYGRTVERTRELDARDGRLQPVLAFVEVGGNANRAIQPGELAGAVMNSIIHEARGIIYFNHNFDGPCTSQHVLRDACGATSRPAVVEVNRRIQQLAPILNTQSWQYPVNPALDTMLKEHDGSFYLFAMPGATTSPGAHSLTLPPGVSATEVEVLFEDRRVPVSLRPNSSASFTDTFDTEHAYHIYKITPSGS